MKPFSILLLCLPVQFLVQGFPTAAISRWQQQSNNKLSFILTWAYRMYMENRCKRCVWLALLPGSYFHELKCR